MFSSEGIRFRFRSENDGGKEAPFPLENEVLFTKQIFGIVDEGTRSNGEQRIFKILVDARAEVCNLCRKLSNISKID